MHSKLPSFAIVSVLLLQCHVLTIHAEDDGTKRTRKTEEIKAAVRKLGTGSDARVELKLYDKTKVNGYIEEVSSEEFVVLDSATSTSTTIAYESVKQVRGNNLSKGVKIAIGIGVLVVLAILIASQTG